MNLGPGPGSKTRQNQGFRQIRLWAQKGIKKRVKEVIQFVKDKNGLVYAEQKMIQFQQEALALLQNFPASSYKEALELMVNYVIERKI